MTLPTIPNPGTGLSTPLVSEAQYRKMTGDLISESADVVAEIAEATRDICIECHRTLSYGQYTENLYLYAKGMVWPSATPIDLSTKIYASATGGEVLFDPATDTVPGGSSIIQGAGIWVGYFSPLPWMPVWSGVIDAQIVITYAGGFYPWQTTVGVTTTTLPGKLARAIITVAYYTLNPSVVKSMGATSVALGGVTVAGDLSSFMRADPELRRTIKRFTRRQAHHWER
jgi:hypothetical protein